MQNKETETKVVSIKSARKPKDVKPEAQSSENEEGLFELLMETIRQNDKNKSRLEKDRKDANKSVLRSYKLKN